MCVRLEIHQHLRQYNLKSRRRFMTSCFLLLILSEFTVAAGVPDTLSFIHVSDLHFCNLTGYHPVFTAKRNHYGEGLEPLKNFFGPFPESYPQIL